MTRCRPGVLRPGTAEPDQGTAHDRTATPRPARTATGAGATVPGPAAVRPVRSRSVGSLAGRGRRGTPTCPPVSAASRRAGPAADRPKPTSLVRTAQPDGGLA